MGEQLRVLVVEDNPVVRELIEHAVKRLDSNIDLLVASDGGAAMKHIGAGSIDLIVLDLYLPVMNGFDIIDHIRGNPDIATTKILAMSASFHDAKDRSLGAGADMFMQKPLKLVDVLDHLRSLLRLQD